MDRDRLLLSPRRRYERNSAMPTESTSKSSAQPSCSCEAWVYGIDGGQAAKRRAFGYGIAMTIICGLSLIISIVYRTFTIGDLLIAALPAVYTYAVLKSA